MSRFPGGIHPDDAKALSADCPIEVLAPPKELRLPLMQHLGAPAAYEGKPRTEFAAGALLAKAGGFVSAGIHAPQMGKSGIPTVTTLPNGRHVPVIPLVSEGEQLRSQQLYDAVLGGTWDYSPISSLDQDQILGAIREAGLVGLGGAAFPTHVKLTIKPGVVIEDLLINAAECEPYLTSNHRLLVEAPRAIVAGALCAARACRAKRIRIGLEDNKSAVLAGLRQACEGTGVEVCLLPTRYPQGGEKQLIHVLTGRSVPFGALPADVGAVVLNVATCTAIARAVLRGAPLTHVVVTVSGRGIRRPANVLAPVGTAVAELVEHCGGLTQDCVKVISGGPMMGFTLGHLGVPITKASGGITCLSQSEVLAHTASACVRCGRCVDVCPMHLVPSRLGLAAQKQAWEVAARHHMNACMECGCCSYICPAQLPLVQLIRVGKIALRNVASTAH